MNACDLWDGPDVELYFYDELDAAAAACVAAHLRTCAACRQRLDDLRAIRRASVGPRVDAPPAGDWSAFMRRLDDACGLRAEPRVEPRRGAVRTALALAAMLAIVAAGLAIAWRVRPASEPRAAPTASGTPTANTSAPAAAAPSHNALVELSEEHLERSKLVVIGLATRDPRRTAPADWEYERELAGSLLADTRLYRLAAEDRGMKDLARVMGDLETVLLQASLSEHADRESLERVQRLITKRDLMVKMQAVGGAAGI